MSEAIAITGVVSMFTLGFFYAGLKGKFFEHRLANFIVRRCFMALGVFLTSLVITIATTMEAATTYGIEDELFRFLWLSNWAGWLMIVVLVIDTMFKSVAMLSEMKQERRFGG